MCEKTALGDNLLAWNKIGAPQVIKSWIKHGVPLVFTDTTPDSFEFYNPHMNKKERSFVRGEIRALLRRGAIRQVNNKPFCVSPIKCVPKKNGKFRLITDLRELNSCILHAKFQLEGINTVAEFIDSKDSMITIDLENGFQHVPVADVFWQYLGFMFENNYYVWCVLPFGLACSPYYFHKVLRPVITFLREQDIKCSIYVDDCIVSACDDRIIDHRDFVLQSFQELGFVVNFTKSHLVPSTKVTYIGYVIDSDGPQGQPWLYIEKHKLYKLKKDIKRCLRLGTVYARLLAKITGQAISMTKSIFPGKLKLRSLYALLSTKSSWGDKLILTHHCVDDLKWWLNYMDSWNGSPLKLPPVECQIWTDASKSGWGSVLNSEAASGTWDRWACSQHINYLELLTVLLAMKSYGQRIKGKHVRILTDSVTAACYINNLGGPVYQLTELAETIWAEALANQVLLSCRHIAGKTNTIADQLSRLPIHYEWKLHPSIFGYIDQLWGPHTIDRFASFSTAQLTKYNSRFLDPNTVGIDALSQDDWGKENNYVNPPFRLLNQVLQIIIAQRAWATIVAPRWTSQPWFRTLRSILMCTPLRLRLNRHSMRMMGTMAEPLKNPSWKIYAWRVYGGKNYHY